MATELLAKMGLAQRAPRSISHLLRNTTDIAMALGISMTATRRQLPRDEGGFVAEYDMHAYYKK